MSHDAAEHGIHVEGNLWACEQKDEHGFTCLLDEGHEGDHEFPDHDPVDDPTPEWQNDNEEGVAREEYREPEDPVEWFIEENER